MARTMTREQVFAAAMKEFDRAEEENRQHREAHEASIVESARLMAEWYMGNMTRDEMKSEFDRLGFAQDGLSSLTKAGLADELGVRVAKKRAPKLVLPAQWASGRYAVKRSITEAEKAREALMNRVKEGEKDGWLIRNVRSALITELQADMWHDVLYLWIENDDCPSLADAVKYIARYHARRRGGIGSDEQALHAEAYFNWYAEACIHLPKLDWTNNL